MKTEVWQEAELTWGLRAATMEIFEPIDAIGQNVENVIDEHLGTKGLGLPVIVYVYCNPEWFIIEDIIGMTDSDVKYYLKWGFSRKQRVLGQFGHGGKDAALNVAGWYYLISRKGESYCAYKIKQTKIDQPVLYKPIWIEEFKKTKDGTLVVIPNKKNFTLDEVQTFLQRSFYKGLLDGSIKIYLGTDYGKKVKELDVLLPKNCIHKQIEIVLDKSSVEKFLREGEKSLKSSPEVKGIYLIPSEKDVVFEETGWSFYCNGKFLTTVPGSRRGIGLLSTDFIVETNQLTTAKNLKLDKRSLYARYILPRLIEWELSNLKEVVADEDAIFDEVSNLLGPLWGGNNHHNKGKKMKRKRALKKMPRFDTKVKGDSGKTPGHGKLKPINNPDQELIMGIIPPDSLFFNKGHPDGKFILKLPQNIKKALMYSRAAFFMPKIKQSRGKNLDSEDLAQFHADALKSQEFWVNAIRRDHGTDKDVIHIGKKRLVISRKSTKVE